MERRRSDRHDVHLPVQLECGSGLTRDMSVSGAYIETPSFDVPVGQTFNFSVTFGQGEARSLTLTCQGLVVRVERRGDQTGIAATIDQFVDINSSPSGVEHDH